MILEANPPKAGDVLQRYDGLGYYPIDHYSEAYWTDTGTVVAVVGSYCYFYNPEIGDDKTNWPKQARGCNDLVNWINNKLYRVKSKAKNTEGVN